MKSHQLVMMVFGALLLAWAVPAGITVLLFFELGEGWREFANALGLQGKPTQWWFWYCVLVITPAAIVGGLALAYVDRWRVALLLIPAVAVIEIAGGFAAYVADRGHLPNA